MAEETAYSTKFITNKEDAFVIFTIENKNIRICARSVGAELCSFVDKRSGQEHEYLWQKSDVWQGQSPLLFPIVGRLRDDVYHIGGKEYQMKKHGFARRSEFLLEQKGEQEMIFLLRDNEATRQVYPFSFELRACYSMMDHGFVMEYRVKNTGKDTMYFSLGAHPGFRCEIGDRVALDEEETASAFQLDSNGLRGAEKLPVFECSRELVITPTVFEKDALIFDGLRSKGATLVRQNGRNVHIDFGGAPCLGLWAKPGAPYVCIEPWYGIDDRWDAGHDFTQKERVCTLEANEEFIFPVTITVV